MKKDFSFKKYLLPVLVVAGCFACNKNINSNSNKSFLSVTNISPNAPPLDISFENSVLYQSLPFDSTTGQPGDPYLTAIAGVHNFKISSGDSSFIDGNIALQVNNYYSLFVFDSLNLGRLNTLIFQDVLTTPADTFSSLRVLNFTDSALYVGMWKPPDTVRLFYVGNAQPNSNPAAFNFRNIKPGYYYIYAQTSLDSGANIIHFDSLYFYGSKIYTMYIKHPPGAFNDTLQTGIIRHN